MSYFYLSFVLSLFFLFFCYDVHRKEKELPIAGKKSDLCLIIGIGLFVRFALALFTKGYGTDMACFSAWSYHVFENGFRNFYDSISFCDYPPGYLYVLSLLGFLNKLFGLSYPSAGANFLLKLPAVLCDMGLILLACRFAKQEKTSDVLPALLLSFSPALIMTSAVWGQVDSVFCVLLLLCLIYGTKEKPEWSALFFTLSALIKPQAFLFAPLVMILFTYPDRVMFGLCKRKLSKPVTVFWNDLITFLFSGTVFCILSVPFFGFRCLPGLVDKYYNTLSSYAYASVNALNLNFLSGGNWADLQTPFLFLTYGTWSTLFLTAIVIAAMWMLARTKEKKAVFFVAGIFLLSVYTLTAKMHERYFFFCIPLFAFAYAFHKRKEIFLLFSGISVTYFLNLVLAYIDQVNHIPKDSGWGMFLSVLHIAFLILSYRTYFRIYPLKRRSEMKKTSSFLKETKTKKIQKTDVLILTIITLIYGIAAFVNLGDTVSPQTSIALKQGDAVTFTLAPGNYDAMMVFEGMDLGDLVIQGSVDGETYEKISDFEKRSVFSWQRFALEQPYQKIQMTVTKTDNAFIELLEVGFLDAETRKPIPPQSVVLNERNITQLSDEQDLVPSYPTFRNGTYFDEIYHARTAYEFNHDLPIYENTHPQLGKLLMAFGIKLFGMTPFGYRCMGTLLGVLMLPILYLFIKRIFRSTFLSAVGTVLFAVDFMHFTQTRIATIDVYVVFFILLMYYFMYRFYEQSKEAVCLKKDILFLFLSGLMFALGISSKWTGVYAGAGLAILYAVSVFQIRKQAKAENKSFGKILAVLLGAGVGFFVLIPAVVYFTVYIPYFICMKDPVNLDSFLRINTHMFQYHSGLHDTHPFASKWYEWILDLKPIWYYQCLNPYAEGSKGTIAAFGNPLVWIGGFAAMGYLLIDTIKKKSDTGLFVLVAYLVQILPWIPVAEARTTFIYHYFPAVPFLILGICYAFDRYLKRRKNDKSSVIAICAFTAGAALLFCLYYPVLSGLECSSKYIDALKLLPGWIF